MYAEFGRNQMKINNDYDFFITESQSFREDHLKML